VLDILLALNGERWRVIDFEVDEAFDMKAFGVSGHGLLPVLVDPTDEVIGDAYVKRAAGPTGEYVDVELSHVRSDSEIPLGKSLCPVIGMAGTSPAMTTGVYELRLLRFTTLCAMPTAKYAAREKRARPCPTNS
jgi:hypothetical protein